MEIAPGLHRIGDDVIAAHLIVTSDGVTVVDAGLPGHRRALRRELATLGLTERDVRGVILTHAHADHIGFAEALRAEYGIPVHVGVGEGARARGEERPVGQERPSSWRIGPVLRFLAVGIGSGGRTRSVTEVTEVADGAVLDLPGAPRVLALPGHSPGHIAVLVPSLDALFVGDALTTRHVLTGVARPQDAPFSEDPAGAKSSIERLRGVQASFVLPGHGPIWRGSPDALADAVVASRAIG